MDEYQLRGRGLPIACTPLLFLYLENVINEKNTFRMIARRLAREGGKAKISSCHAQLNRAMK